jgi:DNA-directed RNA polymerase specialized sigma24 family protein
MTFVQRTNRLQALEDKSHHYAQRLISVCHAGNYLLQDTFLKTFNYLDFFRSNPAFNTWIYKRKNMFNSDNEIRIKLKNTCGIDKNIQLPFIKNKVFLAPDSDFLPKKINKGLVDLNDEYRIPFEMFIDGYKFKEIAEKLDLSMESVKYRIFFTRKKLFKAIHEYSC